MRYTAFRSFGYSESTACTAKPFLLRRGFLFYSLCKKKPRKEPLFFTGIMYLYCDGYDEIIPF